MHRPTPTEYAPFYKGYISKTKGTNLFKVLIEKGEEASNRLKQIPNNKGDFTYQEGKWTIKEVVRHVLDTEWVFSYRALRFSRRDQIDLPGFDQDVFAQNADLSTVSLEQLVQEFESVREATIHLFSSFSDAQLEFLGKADGKWMSVRAAGFVIVGHALHHCDVLEERYL